MLPRFMLGILALAMLTAAPPATPTLDIYFVDVEGGQATLIVTPSHKSLLVDAGFPGNGTFTSTPGDPHKARDAVRIVNAAHAAGLKQIDYLLITHFHPDHDGGVPELAQLLPIQNFIDHGAVREPGTTPGTTEAFNVYAAVRSRGKHIEVKRGDLLPLKDVRVTIVSSSGLTITSALKGGGERNRSCAATELPAQETFENPKSTGFRLDFGQFRFVDLGDLAGHPLASLFCPNDLLGSADVFLVPHHGGSDAADPATFGSPARASRSSTTDRLKAEPVKLSLHFIQQRESRMFGNSIAPTMKEQRTSPTSVLPTLMRPRVSGSK